jgi:hypothetical protein
MDEAATMGGVTDRQETGADGGMDPQTGRFLPGNKMGRGRPKGARDSNDEAIRQMLGGALERLAESRKDGISRGAARLLEAWEDDKLFPHVLAFMGKHVIPPKEAQQGSGTVTIVINTGTDPDLGEPGEHDVIDVEHEEVERDADELPPGIEGGEL